MKILVVTQYFWPEQFKINDLCDALIERGHEVTVLTGLPNYPEGKLYQNYSLLGPYSESKGKIKIIRVPLVTRGKNKSIRLALNYISFCIVSTLLAPLIVRGRFDRIFIYQLSPIFSALPAIVLKYIKRAPIVLWVTDLWPESLEATGVVKNKYLLSLVGAFVQFVYKCSDLIYISSRGFKNRILSMGVSEKKIKFWPQWAETFFLKNKLQDYSDDKIPEGFVVTFAGNIGTSQDFETIIEAAILLKNEAPEIKFMILGDGLMRNWALEQIQKYNLSNTVHLLGRKPIETMPYYYEKSDVLLMTLKDEDLFSITIPSKLQTYMASGKPILAGLNGEGARIVEEWGAGLSCPASNPKKMVEQLLKIYSKSKDELQKMGDNSKKCYLSEFERESLITKLEEDFASMNGANLEK